MTECTAIVYYMDLLKKNNCQSLITVIFCDIRYFIYIFFNQEAEINMVQQINDTFIIKI